MGRMTVAEHVDGVVSTDLVLHGWDLARAAGLDDAIDPDELDRLWPGIEQIPDEMRIPDHFGPGVVVIGPEVDVPADAPLQDRLLGKLGRDPEWRRPKLLCQGARVHAARSGGSAVRRWSMSRVMCR